MQVVVLCNNHSKLELTAQGLPTEEVIWIRERKEFLNHQDADAFLDLHFQNNEEAIQQLMRLHPRPVIINSVTDTLDNLHSSFIRINGWATLLQGKLVEGTCRDNAMKPMAEKIFSLFGKQMAWLPDEPGFITPRVVSMIINEAFFALSDGVSTREEMDTAMKLGTNYPFGPFEWAERIGLQRIYQLLHLLSRDQPRYTPSPLLEASLPGTTHPTG